MKPECSIPVAECPTCNRLFIYVVGYRYTDPVRTELAAGLYETEPARVDGFDTSCGCFVDIRKFCLLIEPGYAPRFIPQSRMGNGPGWTGYDPGAAHEWWER